MSRLLIKTKTKNTHLEVGLDGPMECYFGHLYDDTKEGTDDEIIDSVWRTDNHGLTEWMLKHNVDLDDPYAKQVFEKIQGDLDPGDID